MVWSFFRAAWLDKRVWDAFVNYWREPQFDYFTTHDSVDPNFRIKAKEVSIYPEDRIVFRNLTAYAGKIPVFYFPYLSQPFDGELGYTFAPGYSSSWGAYLVPDTRVILKNPRKPDSAS